MFLKYSKKSVSLAHLMWFVIMHLVCLAVLWLGVSWVAISVALILYCIRVFAVAAFYHRYFSHKSYQMNRFWQFVAAVMGCLALQKGPLWWAAHHRNHHRFSDQAKDPHSPLKDGFWWSHVGWFIAREHVSYDHGAVKDWRRFPELRWLDRFFWLPALMLLAVLYECGAHWGMTYPSAHTSGVQWVVWGFFISSVLTFHAVSLINSLSHMVGHQVYPTGDTSRNHLLIALLTLGDGWHNNHHFYPNSARHGFRWWQIDLTYYGLWVLQILGVVSHLRPVPHRVKSHVQAPVPMEADST